MKVDVFTYEWTYGDWRLDENVTRTSDFKVTPAFIEQRKEDNLLGAMYRLLEHTREAVDSSLVDPDGRYHPDLKQPNAVVPPTPPQE